MDSCFFMPSPLITRVEVTKIAWDIADCGLGLDAGIICYRPGDRYPMSLFMTRIETDAGVVGEYPLRTDLSRMGSVLLGLPVLEREAIRHKLMIPFRGAALAGLDIMLWDIAGKLFDQPVYRLLGGATRALPAYASTLNGGDCSDGSGLSSPESYAEHAEQCLAMGYQGFKIHPFTHYHLPDHIRAVELLGERVGGKMDLMLDSFCIYRSYADALKVGHACDAAGFYWIEDHLFDGGASIAANRRLKQTLRTPFLLGERTPGVPEKLNLLLSGSTDFIRGRLHDDGVTGTMQLAGAAEALGADVEIHGMGPAQRHVMAALQNSNYYEIPWTHPTVDCPQTTNAIYACDYRDGLRAIDEAGFVYPPEGPGYGVAYDWAAVEKLSVGRSVLG